MNILVDLLLFDVEKGHIIATPDLTSWAHVDHFDPDKVLRILSFYTEKEMTVMTNIKVLKYCSAEEL